LKKVSQKFLFVAGIGYIYRVNNKIMNKIDLSRELAWVTFLKDGFETIWFPVTDVKGNQMIWSDKIMDHCRAQFNNEENWVSFGIAPTSQMIMGHSVRDNF